MFLAIINDTYTEVRESINTENVDFQLGQFIREQMKKMLPKCCRKKNIQPNDVLNVNSFLNDKIVTNNDDNDENKRNFVSLNNVFKEYSIVDEEIAK